MQNKNIQNVKLFQGVINGLESYRNVFLSMKVYLEQCDSGEILA